MTRVKMLNDYFTDSFLDSKICNEYSLWITNCIKWRCEDCNQFLSSEGLQSVKEVIDNFTNRDYLTVSDNLTSAIEKQLLICGVPPTLAIRLSWKWSD